MRQPIKLFLSLLAVIPTITVSTPAAAVPDPGANRIHFQISCDPTDNSCFTDANAMLDWIWDVRQPSQAAPLEVDIGAGVFELPFRRPWCDGPSAPTGPGNTGYVSFSGAGRNATTLTWSAGRNPSFVIQANQCTNLTFKNLTIDGWNGASGVEWHGDGQSIWSDVDILRGFPYGWFDTGGLHYWFGSRVEMAGSGYKFAYRANGGETWFYGGDIVATSSDPSLVVAVWAVGGEVHIFGSSVRSITTSSNDTVNDGCSLSGIAPLVATNGGSIHMHGGIAASISKGTGNVSVCGAAANLDGFIHTPDTAFRLEPSGTGIATRTSAASGGKVESPYQWPSSNTPPAIVSISGQDTFVESDCDNSGDCSGAGTNLHPHLMIYDKSCNGGTDPWFDVVTGACRQ